MSARALPARLVHAPLYVPPLPPVIEPKAEPEPKPTHKRSPPPPAWLEESYSWTGDLREWVSVRPVHYVASPVEEATHLEHWKAHRLAEEQANAKRQMLWVREKEEPRCEEEECARRRHNRRWRRLPWRPSRARSGGSGRCLPS